MVHEQIHGSMRILYQDQDLRFRKIPTRSCERRETPGAGRKKKTSYSSF
jgi:hypothetical protein